jgi:hypothetical protein
VELRKFSDGGRGEMGALVRVAMQQAVNVMPVR